MCRYRLSEIERGRAWHGFDTVPCKYPPLPLRICFSHRYARPEKPSHSQGFFSAGPVLDWTNWTTDHPIGGNCVLLRA